MKFLPLKSTDLTVKILKQVQRNLLFHSITKQFFPFFLLSHIIVTKDCICFIFKRWQIPSWTWRQAICSVRTAGYTNTAWRFLLRFRKTLINTQTLLFASLHFHLSLRREFVSRLENMIWNFNQRFSFFKNNFKKERSIKGLRQLEREIVQMKPRQILYNSLATIRPSKEKFVYFRLIYSLPKRFHHGKLDVANIESCKDLNSEVIDHVFACCEFEWSIDRTHSARRKHAW